MNEPLSARDQPDVSIVVPIHNESESLGSLIAEIREILNGHRLQGEIIVVNDGSTDDSAAILHEYVNSLPELVVVHLRRNFGKAAALDAGFRLARAERIVTLDGDLQDDPSEIPRLLAALDNGLDIVSGWKQKRYDPLAKRLPSRLFNVVVSRVSGVRLRDLNSGLKAYTREAADHLRLYGELHRFIPVIAHWQGFLVGEISVNHRPRRFGTSKYGGRRLIKGFLDLLTVLITTRFSVRPLHMFGTIGLGLGLVGGLALGYLTVLWFLGYRPIGDRPLLLFGLLMVVTGVQLLSTGLIAELIQRTQLAGQSHYSIRTIERHESAGDPVTKRQEI